MFSFIVIFQKGFIGASFRVSIAQGKISLVFKLQKTLFIKAISKGLTLEVQLDTSTYSMIRSTIITQCFTSFNDLANIFFLLSI